MRASVERMEARLAALADPSLIEPRPIYDELALRFERDLGASRRDVALAKSAALMVLQALASAREMKPVISRAEAGAEYYTDEGCDILELSNSADDPHASIARARVAPGVTTRWHQLRATTERYVMLEGCGRVEVGELPPQLVEAGHVVIIPPLCRQRIANVGETDLVFLAICTPRYRQNNYQAL
ncbi:MAG TPA: cupin domain-containing protein [Burkholderiales bacterium]|nr:cupin domain-containing protein [Burkholderiales bacterium]